MISSEPCSKYLAPVSVYGKASISLSRSEEVSINGAAIRPDHADSSPLTLSVVECTGCPFSSCSFFPLESSRSCAFLAISPGWRFLTQMTLSLLLTAIVHDIYVQLLLFGMKGAVAHGTSPGGQDA